jgi:hypothetical protein
MANDTIVKECQKHTETMSVHGGLADKLAEFILVKTQNPTQRFGSSDSQFTNDGALGKLKISHAHLSHDVSVLYRIKGKPPTIYLFGLFSHKESGTDKNNPNRNITKTLAKTLSTQFPELDEEDAIS